MVKHVNLDSLCAFASLRETIAHHFSAKNRKRKFDRFMDEMLPTSSSKVLDIGYSDREYSPSDNYLEKHYAYTEMITAVGVDEPIEFPGRYPSVKVMKYDGRTLPFHDKAFDICWSNAVIEHVGDHARQVAFIREMARVGKQLYFTTPNRYFPIETHTRTPLLHYLPKPIFDRYLNKIGKKWATGDYMRLLGEADLKELLNEAGVRNYKLIKNRLFGFVLDFVVVADCN